MKLKSIRGCLLLSCIVASSFADDLGQLAKESDSAQASALARKLQDDSSTDLLSVLQQMKNSTEVNKNWLLSVAQTVADRDPKASKAILEQFLPRLSEDTAARYWAFVHVTRGDTEKREALLESMLADPCLELRYEAVALGMKRIEKAKGLSDAQRVSRYEEMLAASRLPSQIQEIAKQLKELGKEVDLLKHFGFVPEWSTVGPFNNVEKVGFAQAYAPEELYLAGKLDVSAGYEGKTGEVKWTSVSTEEQDGTVDLAETFNKEKGAVAYVFGQFVSEEDLDCQLRLGSPNASKVWVNGQQVMAWEIYHAGGQIDQYVAPVSLREGSNSILIKSCQNEQEQSWAQDWTFQLRFTDDSGYAIQPASK